MPRTPRSQFTRKKVDDLLGAKLKGNVLLPNPSGPAVGGLVFHLNFLQWKVRGWTGPWSKEQNRREMIAGAIQYLIEALPPQREDYVAELDLAGKKWEWNNEDVAKEAAETAAKAMMNASADLAAFDALIAALITARERGLPLTFNWMLSSLHEPILGRPKFRWLEFVRELYDAFDRAVPNAGKRAIYRLIEAVVPDISGEHPSYDAIETELKRPKRAADRAAKRTRNR
jgi:hypothetical protein